MRSVFIILFLAPILAAGQATSTHSPDRMKCYLNLYKQAEGNTSSVLPVLSLAEKLVQKKESFKRTNDFLSYLFSATHQRFLRHFDKSAGFGQLLTDRTYNCLTATALYALLLDHVGLDYKIIETNYHIFLLIQSDQGEVLFETTDPANGFISDPKEIANRIVKYREHRIQEVASNKTYYRYKVDLYKEVNLDEVLGLLHYNLSINAYNQQSLSTAIEQFELAVKLYQSPRMEEYSRIILLSVKESDLSDQVKESYLRSLQSLRESQLDITASAY
jgi:hypothetical protein